MSTSNEEEEYDTSANDVVPTVTIREVTDTDTHPTSNYPTHVYDSDSYNEYPGEDDQQDEQNSKYGSFGRSDSIASSIVSVSSELNEPNQSTSFGRKSDIATTDDFFAAVEEETYEGEWPGEPGWEVKEGVSYEEFEEEEEMEASIQGEFEYVEEEEVVEEEIVQKPKRVTSEDVFLQTIMTIPEEPAKKRMDLLPDKKRGPELKLRYYDDNGKLLPTPDISNIIKTIEPRMHQSPSIESFFKKPYSVDCQFYYTADGKIYTKDCRLDVSIWALKQEISKFVKVPGDNLDFRRNRNLVADKRTLMELGGTSKKKMKFTVEINKRLPGNYEIWNPKKHEAKTKPEVKRKIKIESENGNYEVGLVVAYDLQKMRYMGGYYDRRKKIKYLNAITQTTFEERVYDESTKHRACQTFSNKNISQQTDLDKSQQMEKDDFYVSKKFDRFIYAKPYFSFDWWEEKRKAAAVTIQRYWRRWLAIKERKRRMEGLIARVEWAESIRKGRTDQRLAIIDDEIKRQYNPTRLLDMELLYRAINAWRKDEEEFVRRTRWGAERKAALATLTELEADLLLDLEKTKNRIKVTHKEDYIDQVFTKMGKPTRWLGAKTNIFINMDSTDKLRVRHLHSLYKELQQPVRSKDERLELLEKLTNMVKHYSSNMCKYLVSLVNREIAMMNRYVSKRLLDGVRLRITNGLYHLCQDPNFNTEAKMLQKVPWDEQKLRKDMVQCKGCRRMQYRDEFTILRGTTVTTRCHNCMNLYRTAILRVDLNLYRHMLKELRRDELQSGVTNSVSLLIDAFDIQFLVDQIWHGQSALSGIDNRYLLRLCRWNRDLPWMPWNCVLLTEEEAVAHLQLDDMHDAYRETFFHKVSITQSAARTYYERLSKLSLNLDEKVKGTCETVQIKMAYKSKRRTQLKNKLKAAVIKESSA